MPFAPQKWWVGIAVAVAGLAPAAASAQTPPPSDDEPPVAPVTAPADSPPTTGEPAPLDGQPPAEDFTYDSRRVTEDSFEEARLLFLAGRQAFDNGRFEHALEAFRRAHDLTADPHLLYDIAVTLDRLRRDRDAVDAFQLYLDREPESPDRRDVEARMRILREHLAARAAPPAPDAPALQREDRPTADEGGRRPYVWVLVAVAVLGAGAAAITAVALSNRPDPTPGAEGVVLYGLSW